LVAAGGASPFPVRSVGIIPSIQISGPARRVLRSRWNEVVQPWIRSWTVDVRRDSRHRSRTPPTGHPHAEPNIARLYMGQVHGVAPLSDSAPLSGKRKTSFSIPAAGEKCSAVAQSGFGAARSALTNAFAGTWHANRRLQKRQSQLTVPNYPIVLGSSDYLTVTTLSPLLTALCPARRGYGSRCKIGGFDDFRLDGRRLECLAPTGRRTAASVRATWPADLAGGRTLAPQ
jgi:hypothetical protein